jgi:AraC-like DNA-binding protein
VKALFEKISEPGQSFVVRTRRDRSFDFCWHFHPEYELTYIVKSSGRRYVGDSIEDYHDGDLILLGPNLPHTWGSTPQPRRSRQSHVAIYTQFSENFAGADFLSKPELAALKTLFSRASRGLKFSHQIEQRVGREMELLNDAGGMKRLVKLLEILDILVHARNAKPLASAGFSPALKRFDESRIDAVCNYVHENLGEAISLPEAASRAHMSVSAFSRFFHRALGRTFVEYVNELRIGEACRQLIESEKSVAEIAFAAGFENLSNFNRRFLKLKAMSPRDYRRRFCER